mgnify:CR=1 FL=1
MNKLAKRLIVLREENKKTKEEIASFLDIQPRAYARYESGERIPDLEKLIQLAEYFGCTLDYLAGVDLVKQEKHYTDRSLVYDYQDLVSLGYNNKLAHGIIKEIYDHQSYEDRIQVSDNDKVKYVLKTDVENLLRGMLESVV